MSRIRGRTHLSPLQQKSPEFPSLFLNLHRNAGRTSPHPRPPSFLWGQGSLQGYFELEFRLRRHFLSRAGPSPPPGAQEKVPPAASEAAVTRPSGLQTPVRAGTENKSPARPDLPGGKGVCGHDCKLGVGLWNRGRRRHLRGWNAALLL